jgi:small subunit ribosomal protein S1
VGQARTNSAKEVVEGVIFGRVKGGFTVDLDGAVAFLPGSQVDIRPVRDVTPLMDVPQPFQILKMDRRRGNIVVSRRAVLEETRAEQRSGLIQNLKEGQIIDGVVKNITDYGAFVDLGGIDGLLHVTDMSYKRVNHPSEVIAIGDTVRVQIIRINQDTQRISLGMKQLESDPWDGVAAKYPVGAKLRGTVTNITEYGAFVELEAGHRRSGPRFGNAGPRRTSTPARSFRLAGSRRHGAGSRQRQAPHLARPQAGPAEPVEAFAEKHPVGSTVEGEVKNATEFGLFIGLDGDVDGMVHMSDIAWGISGEDALALHRKGEQVSAVVLDVDVEKERISLGMKQLERAPGHRRQHRFAAPGEVVTVTVLEVRDGGLEVQAGEDGSTGFIKRSDLGRDRDEQRPDRFQVGQKLDAMVTGFDRSKKPNFSIKARQLAEEKEAVEQYGSSDPARRWATSSAKR